MGPCFVDYVLSIVNADRAVRVIQPPSDDLEGVTKLPCPPSPPPPPGTQVEGALSGIEESVVASPTPLEGKEAHAEQSVEGPETKAQPAMATPTQEDTHPKVLIRGEWQKVPDGYPRDASGQMAKQIVVELHAACRLNTNPSAKPKSSDTKADLIYKRAFCNYL